MAKRRGPIERSVRRVNGVAAKNRYAMYIVPWQGETSQQIASIELCSSEAPGSTPATGEERRLPGVSRNARPNGNGTNREGNASLNAGGRNWYGMLRKGRVRVQQSNAAANQQNPQPAAGVKTRVQAQRSPAHKQVPQRRLKRRHGNSASSPNARTGGCVQSGWQRKVAVGGRNRNR